MTPDVQSSTPGLTDDDVLTAPELTALPGVRHAFFTRRGGVSEGLYAGLNVGRGSRDDPQAVERNRALAARRLGLEEAALLTVHQVHSARVISATAPLGPERPQADGVVTATTGLACGALSADCAPILLADAEARVVGAAHAGWKGALDGVAEAAVAAMAAVGARPERIVAVIGPCIGPGSYEVGADYMHRFTAESADAARFFRPAAAADKHMFDLPGYVVARLARAGVTARWIAADTYPDDTRFFSNRRATHRGEPDYGRLLSAITLA